MTSTELAREAFPQKIKRRIKQHLGPWGVFFEGFLKHPVMVGSIIPSSRFTIEKMLAPVNWDECKLFVEYGPGVGTFCRPVLDRLRRDGTLIVIDTNPNYIDYLRATITDSRFIGPYRESRDKVIAAAPYPASTLLIVQGLADPGMLVEIEAVAAK